MKKIVSFFAAAFLMIGMLMPMTAMAVVATPTDFISMESNLSVPSGNPGDIVMIVLPLTRVSNAFWWFISDVTVEPSVSVDPQIWPFEIENISYTRKINMDYSNRVDAVFYLKISEKASAGTKPLTFNVSYTATPPDGIESQYKKVPFTTYVNILSSGLQSGGSEGGSLTLESVDDKGNSISAPKGNAGENVTIVLPIKNSGRNVTDIVVSPEVSTSIDAFPFVVEQLNYEQKIEQLQSGETKSLRYTFKLSPNVLSGTKAVAFKAKYKVDGLEAKSNFIVYVNVIKGAEPETTEPGNASTPKLIIKQYNITPTKVYAGETFDLDLVFENTSSTDNVKNLKIAIINENVEGSYVLPAENGSNTIYISKIGKAETAERSVKLQVRPDTPPKPQMLTITLEYENDEAITFSTIESITVPVSQHVRMVIDDPSMYEPTLYAETPTGVFFSILNMGKASVYNLMVDIEGQGLRMEESYFGGTIATGSQTRADFNIIASEPGEIDANIVITYEDEYGEQTVVNKPLHLSVMSMDTPVYNEDMPPEMIENPQPQGMPAIWIVAIAAGIVVMIIVLIVILRKRAIKKREKELEE